MNIVGMGPFGRDWEMWAKVMNLQIELKNVSEELDVVKNEMEETGLELQKRGIRALHDLKFCRLARGFLSMTHR